MKGKSKMIKESKVQEKTAFLSPIKFWILGNVGKQCSVYRLEEIS
jgi:hypothetical protein